MTVKELIEHLQMLPADAAVGARILDYDDDDPQYYSIRGFEVDDDGNGDVVVDIT
jgi:hypothetical protein